MNRTKLLLATGAAAALLAACSSSRTSTSTSAASTPSSTRPSSTAPAAVVTSASPTTAAPTGATTSVAAARGALSGTWKGRYSGAYLGTFVLHWTQSSAKLTGTINLSTGPGAMTINGTVAGGRIQFGTVGSQAITYTGSVSGNTMSGQYQVAGGAGGSGSWSATRG